MESEFVTVREVAEAMGKSVRWVNMRAKEEGWPSEVVNKRGDKRFLIAGLPGEVQGAIVKNLKVPVEMMPVLSPEAALEAAKRMVDIPTIYKGIANYVPRESWTAETAIGPDVVRDPEVQRWIQIIQEAQAVPAGWKKRAWVEAVATKHETTFQTVYRKIKKYEKAGLAGLHHTKSTRNQPKAWSSEAIEWWIGLVLKKEHRKIAKDVLYVILCEEAQRQGWRIGGYRSALWWLDKKATPQLLALQRGGMRALDNTLPPVVRSYSDLDPFEILVGDQHRFDFWVTDEETGEVFRPEGYFWQDLRTRCFYGGALDRKYDSYLIGLALRMGLKIFGAFDSIYTDNGKPELSKYIMGIMKDMRGLGLRVEREIDLTTDNDSREKAQKAQKDNDLINPCVLMPGTQRKAIVRNAKAKMIEGTFNVLEGILRDHFLVPGYVKKLGGMPEENEVDEKEIDRLARAGKLLTFWEFAATLFRAMDYYNSEKSHRGVIKEWKSPKPKTATPMDCLRACCSNGWKPVYLSEEAVDLVFLLRAERIVDRGRITFMNEVYGNQLLIDKNKSRVELRYDPLDPGWLLVFHGGEYLCRAEPVEYSSMKDQELASRKIEEKRRTRKGFVNEYKRFTAAVPDIREYSRTPALEKAAAIIGKEKREKRKEIAETYRPLSQEELEAGVKRLEEKKLATDTRRITQIIPKRPEYFMTDLDRYKWILKCETAGGVPGDEDLVFKTAHEAGMDEGQREYWECVKEVGG